MEDSELYLNQAIVRLDFRHIAMLIYAMTRVMLKHHEIYDRGIYDALLAVHCMQETEGFITPTQRGTSIAMQNLFWYKCHCWANIWVAPWLGLDRLRRWMCWFMPTQTLKSIPRIISYPTTLPPVTSEPTRRKGYQWPDPATTVLQ